jgi:signal transduction histidine kinase
MHRAHRWPFVLAGVVIAVLAVVAKVQIDWIDSMSETRLQRRRAELEGDARRFATEIDIELAHLAGAFEVRTADLEELSQHVERWRATAADPRLLGGIYVVGPSGPLRFDPDRRQLQPAVWPRQLAAVDDLHLGFNPDAPALIVPVRDRPPAMLALLIDDAYLTRQLMPELARVFGRDYDVAVARRDRVVFRTDPQWPASVDAADPDLATPILVLMRRRERDEHPPLLPPPQPPPTPWRLLVRHHGMPLAAVIAAERRREIAATSLLLALIGAVAVMLALAARRAERLRRQQLEFVAGITHELNTPLAALGAAGQNLADGVAVDTVRYGAAIVKETRRLGDLVDQILRFGGMESAGAPAPGRATSLPRAAIDEALEQCRWMAEERGVRIECDAAGDLPAVRGDAASVARAVQNLVANAVRHGGEGGWVGVRAGRDDGFVDITVEDRGPGIVADDLPHLFEPFYRGRNAQTRGSGIGLAIVDRIARANGGSVRVAKRRERGAAFTLRLPVAEGPP